MKLKKYRVTDFRSVADSGWIEVDEVTALIGTNESGKTNLLLPLWRLNPATKDGDINLIADYPRKLLTELRNKKPQPVFIEAVFEIDEALSKQIAEITGVSDKKLRLVSVARRYDGSHLVDFPEVESSFTARREEVNELLSVAASEIDGLPAVEQEQDLRTRAKAALALAVEALPSEKVVSSANLKAVLKPLKAVSLPSDAETSTVVARIRRVLQDLEDTETKLAKSHPRESEEAKKLVLQHLPKFVYYANYGNLDSEIYLPIVIANLKRIDLGQKEAAKARTLKVLFEFVRLSPQEILELGQEPAGQLSPEQTVQAAEKKKTRSILLQSASALLTEKFRAWWKQGNYRFRFEADGNFFRLWVSDDMRPEEVELEGRSSGLQWFLSFYLVFLVESGGAHSNSILLLDEPGLSLHPLAQRDLSAFFDGLAEKNQLLYTTHSPFLMDADRLDRARKVFVAEDGTSKATPDLGAQDGDPSQRGAGYAVHAAIGISVAESLLLGCTPIVVEGPSDQHYLTAIKTLLVGAGKLKLGRELVFPPAGGAKGVKAVASILTGRDSQLPIALLDSDEPGRRFAKTLKESLYAEAPGLLLTVGSFAQMENAEIEDLIPSSIISQVLDRWQREPESPFSDAYRPGEPIVPQIEAWAAKHAVKLDPKSWKPELAKRVKTRLLELGPSQIPPDALELWDRLFVALRSRQDGE